MTAHNITWKSTYSTQHVDKMGMDSIVQAQKRKHISME